MVSQKWRGRQNLQRFAPWKGGDSELGKTAFDRGGTNSIFLDQRASGCPAGRGFLEHARGILRSVAGGLALEKIPRLFYKAPTVGQCFRQCRIKAKSLPHQELKIQAADAVTVDLSGRFLRNHLRV